MENKLAMAALVCSVALISACKSSSKKSDPGLDLTPNGPGCVRALADFQTAVSTYRSNQYTQCSTDQDCTSIETTPRACNTFQAVSRTGFTTVEDTRYKELRKNASTCETQACPAQTNNPGNVSNNNPICNISSRQCENLQRQAAVLPVNTATPTAQQAYTEMQQFINQVGNNTQTYGKCRSAGDCTVFDTRGNSRCPVQPYAVVSTIAIAASDVTRLGQLRTVLAQQYGQGGTGTQNCGTTTTPAAPQCTNQVCQFQGIN